MTNPFIVSVLAEGDAFADREAEVERIATAFRSPGGKLVVYGERRLGKSSALVQAADAARSKKVCVAIASFATASDGSEAAQRVLSAARAAIGTSWREVLEGIGRTLKAGFEVTPSLEPDGQASFRFRFGVEDDRQPGKVLPDVLDALDDQLERRNHTLGLGLDEFQRIYQWGGEDAEWALRDAIQHHRSIAYVLAGSKRHLIEAMLGTKGRALWKLVDVLRFGPIEPSVLAAWIDARSTATGIRLPPGEAGHCVTLAGPRTRDVVLLARTLWNQARAAGIAEAGAAVAAFDGVVFEQAELYRAIFAKLAARQQSVLRVFAAEQDVQITAATTLRQYRLGPKSSVQSSVDALVEDEHLARRDDGGYVFDDPFFRRWVQLYALPDIGIEPPGLEA